MLYGQERNAIPQYGQKCGMDHEAECAYLEICMTGLLGFLTSFLILDIAAMIWKNLWD